MATTLFTGSSTYSRDFQAVIERAVAIASLPLSQLERNRSQLSAQAAAYRTIESKVNSLKETLPGLATSVENSYTASLSVQGSVSVTFGSGVRAGRYDLEVTNIGSSTRLLSKQPAPGAEVGDPGVESISPDASFTLEISDPDDPPGTPATAITITPAANTLNALVDKINEMGAGTVQATIVNYSSSSEPDYRLSLQSLTLGNKEIHLKAGVTDLMDVTSTGTDAKYKVNGSPEITSQSRSITIAPGVTVDMLAKSADGVATAITVGRSTAVFENSANAFINAYNAVVGALDAQRTEDGVLKGDSILSSVNSMLRNIATYTTSSSGIGSLAHFGIVFDKAGKLYLDKDVFERETAGSLESVPAFLGESGASGFIGNAEDVVATLAGSTGGILNSAISTTDASVVQHSDRIEAEGRRIELLTTTLQDKMAKADQIIASLQQQVLYFSGLFEAMRNASQANR